KVRCNLQIGGEGVIRALGLENDIPENHAILMVPKAALAKLLVDGRRPVERLSQGLKLGFSKDGEIKNMIKGVQVTLVPTPRTGRVLEYRISSRKNNPAFINM